jgi:hypothetical protein
MIDHVGSRARTRAHCRTGNSWVCAPAVLAAEACQPADPIAEHYQGGTFCAAEYTAKTQRD